MSTQKLMLHFYWDSRIKGKFYFSQFDCIEIFTFIRSIDWELTLHYWLSKKYRSATCNLLTRADYYKRHIATTHEINGH